MVTSELLSTFRRIMFAITGLTCLAYAVLALLQIRPDLCPGIGSGTQKCTTGLDEGYIMDKRGAEAHAFWIALMLYPIFGLLMTTGAVALPTAFGAMGTLTGAAYLLLFNYYDAIGRR